LTKYIYTTLITLLLPLSVKAQISTLDNLKLAQSVADNLEQEGFQSIDIYQGDQSLVVAYENRVYRFDALALKRVIQLTEKSLGEVKTDLENITFITKRNNIPMLQADWNNSNQTALGSFPKDLSISRDITTIDKHKKVIKAQNSGNFKAELVLRPYLTMELGNLYTGDNYIHLIDLRPKLNVYLWKGAHFSYEFILPISNEFKTQAPHWSEIRPRVISFTQQFRLPKTTFLNASVGLFSRSRYGISTEISKYFWQSRFRLTGKVGYTGHMSYVRYNGREVEKNWVYTDLNYFDYKIGGHYWFPKWNTQISVEYGKVLFYQTALFFKCTQKFREIDLGFYAFKTPEGRNYGFEIGLPLFPKKYWKPKLFSVRSSKRFRYNYLSGFDRTRQVVLVREYQAQGMYGEFLQDLNPHFLKFYLKQN